MSFASDALHALRRGRRLVALSYILAATVLVAVLPVAGLALYAAYEVSHSHRADTEGRLLDVARALASDFESELQVRITAARLLANGAVLDAWQPDSQIDSQEITRVAQSFANSLGETVISVWQTDASTPAMLVTASSPADPPSSLEGVREVQQVIGRAVLDRGPRLSAMFRLPSSPKLMVAVAYPVIRDGAAVGAVVVTLTADLIQRVVAARPVADQGIALVTDSAFRIVARFPERFIGDETTKDYQQAVSGAVSGIIRGTRLDGVRTVAAFTSLQIAPDFKATVGAPVNSVEQGWLGFRKALIAGALGACAVLVGAIAFTMRVWNSARGLVSDQDAYLAIAIHKSGLATWESNQITGRAIWSSAHFDMLGYPRNLNGETSVKLWWDAVHPDDVAKVREQWRKGEEHPEGLLRLSYRIIRQDSGEVRWFETMGRFVDAERLIGVIVDMTDTKREEEQRLLLAREVDHRSKNLLAVVQAMLTMTQAKDVAALRASLLQRVGSLAKTHSLLARNLWIGSSVRETAESELDFYGNVISLDGPEVLIRAETVQPLAMVFHELATNAVKYGALSVRAGLVVVSWHVDQKNLVLHWSERGGPKVTEPDTKGFGSRMIARVLSQTSGTIAMTWEPTGLTVMMTLPLAKVGR